MSACKGLRGRGVSVGHGWAVIRRVVFSNYVGRGSVVRSSSETSGGVQEFPPSQKEDARMGHPGCPGVGRPARVENRYSSSPNFN